MKKKTWVFVLSGILSCNWGLQGQENTNLQTSAYRTSIAQDEVRKQAEEVRASLSLLLQDFYQNQLQSKSSVEAQDVASQLANLNDEQIRPLIEMLREAGMQGDGVGSKLGSASQTQKKIQVDLKTLENRLTLHINQSATQQRLRDLILRQTSNLRETELLAASGKPANKMSGSLVPLVPMTRAEQEGLRQETGLAVEMMQKIVDTVPAAERKGFAESLQEATRLDLTAFSATASKELAEGKFTEAVKAQKGLLEGLQGMLAKLNADRPLEEKVQAVKDKLQQLATEQKQLAESTKKADDTTKRDLLEAQSKLTDQVNALQKEALGLNAKAALESQKATPLMDDAAKTLRETPRFTAAEKNKVAQSQEAAAEKLQEASQAMQQQLDQMAAQNNSAPQNVAEALQKMAKLDQQVRTAMAEQQALDQKPENAAAQQQLADKAAALQQQALPMSQEAAQNLGQAAQQMQQNSQKASESLAQASQALQQQMQQMKQMAAQQEQLQNLADQIAAAQANSEKAEQVMNQQGKADLAPAIQEMQQAQKALQQANAAAAAVPGAEEALQEAGKKLAESILNAAQVKKEQAAGANTQAQEAMQKAQKGVGEAMAQLAASMPGMPQPGQPGDSGQSGQSGMVTDGNPSGEGMETGVQSFMANSGAAGTAGQVQAGLKPQDREAIAMLKKEKAPAEYQGMVQQYLQNLAEGVSPAGMPQ